MQLHAHLLRTFCLVVMAMLITGCVPAVDMSKGSSWMPSAEQTNRQMALGNIVIKRPTERGGSGSSTIGRVRGGFGNPFSVQTTKGKELDVIMHSMAGAALQNSGFDTLATQNNNSAPRLEIDVVDFWCDGYMAYTVKAAINVRIIQSNTVIAMKTLETSRVFMLSFGYGPMPVAYQDATRSLTIELAAFLQSEEVSKALAQGNSK